MGNWLCRDESNDCQAYQFSTNNEYTEEKHRQIQSLTAGMTHVGEYIQTNGKPLIHQNNPIEFKHRSLCETETAKQMGYKITQRLEYSDKVALVTRIDGIEYIFTIIRLDSM